MMIMNIFLKLIMIFNEADDKIKGKKFMELNTKFWIKF